MFIIIIIIYLFTLLELFANWLQGNFSVWIYIYSYV